jgi:hypothetical protein
MKNPLALLMVMPLVAACAPSGAPRATTATQIAATPRPSRTPAPTDSPLPSPLPPTPDVLDTPIADGFLLAPSQDPACELPCWQGLRVGVSDREDVQAMFDEVLGFNGSLDVFRDRLMHEVLLEAWGLDFPTMQPGGYSWEEDFGLYVLVVENTGTLKGIQIANIGTVGSHAHTPQDLIRTLGIPSAVYAHVRRDGVSLLLLYGELGIASDFDMPGSIWERIENGQTRTFTDFCLDSSALVVEDFIVEPFRYTDPASLTDMQYAWFGRRVEGRHPIEDFGLTLEDFADIAVQEHPCLSWPAE